MMTLTITLKMKITKEKLKCEYTKRQESFGGDPGAFSSVKSCRQEKTRRKDSRWKKGEVYEGIIEQIEFPNKGKVVVDGQTVIVKKWNAWAKSSIL